MKVIDFGVYPCFGISIYTGSIVRFSGVNTDENSPWQGSLVGKYQEGLPKFLHGQLVTCGSYRADTDEYTDFEPQNFELCDEAGNIIKEN